MLLSGYRLHRLHRHLGVHRYNDLQTWANKKMRVESCAMRDWKGYTALSISVCLSRQSFRSRRRVVASIVADNLQSTIKMPIEHEYTLPTNSNEKTARAIALLRTRLSKFETEHGRLGGLSYQPVEPDEAVITTSPKAGTTWLQQVRDCVVVCVCLCMFRSMCECNHSRKLHLIFFEKS